MMITAVIFGADPTKAKAELHDTLQFETELVKVSSTELAWNFK